MTAPDDREPGTEVPAAAGMPAMDPPSGGAAGDPDSPDPADVMAPRPGPPPTADDDAT
jgi:hypothetical protein